MPEAAVEVKAPPVVTVGDVPTFIKNAETFPPKEPDSQKPADQAPAPVVKTTEPEKVEDEKEAVEKPKPGKSSYERRLDRAYRREAEAKARAEFLERQYEELKSKSAPVAPAVGAPRMEDFTDIQEYAKAYATFEKDNAIKAYEGKQRAAFQKQAQEALVRDWENKADRGLSKYDDFVEVVGELKPTTPWARAIMRAENGEDVAHYLGKHLKEIEAISKLDPESQAREIAKIEAKLLATPAAPKQPSKAPAPIVPVTGTAQPEAAIRDGMPYEDFVKLRNKQLGRK